MRFNLYYAATAVLLFMIEVAIALFAHDDFVRPFLGDTLAVVFVYACVMAVADVRPITAAGGALVLAFAIEICQYFKVINKVGLNHSQLATTLFGTSFSWYDILSYTAGFAAVMIFEIVRGKMRD